MSKKRLRNNKDIRKLFFYDTMAKTRARKESELKQFEDRLTSSKSVVFVRQDGLSALDEVELRKKLRSESIDYGVVKKTLVKRALTAKGLPAEGVTSFTGTVAAAFGNEDEVAPAKVLNTFAKTHETMKFLGGFVGGVFMDAVQAKAFAALPGKKELLGQLVSAVSGPLRGIVGVLQGNLRDLVYALKAVQEKKS